MGRELELRALAESVEGGSRVVCVHGIAGIGKSALVGAFVTVSEPRGRRRRARLPHVEPTERGFLHAAGGLADLGGLLQRLNDMESPVVLTLDHYEVFRLIDTWLRQVLAPALPAGVTLMLAGRERPVAAVAGDRRLPQPPARPARRGGGPPDARAPRCPDGEASPASTAIARGHPLALVLASAGVAEHPELALEARR